jgi:hypothetical protein
MSTRIYDAYKVTKGGFSTILRIRDVLNADYEKYVLHFLEAYKNTLVKNIRLKNGCMRTRTNKDKKLSELDALDLQFVLEDVSRAEWNHPLNFSAGMVLYYYQRKFYLQFFGTGRYWNTFDKCIEPFIRRKLIMDFHYQDQTDRPEDISRKDYERRGRIWDRIFGATDIPACAGFVYDFWSHHSVILSKFYEMIRNKREEQIK